MGFFDKLTGVKTEEKKEEKKPKEKKPKEKKKGKKAQVEKAKTKPEPEPEEKKPTPPEAKTEGQLAIDVYETDDDFVVQSTIAGVKAEDLDISIEDGLVTIRGARQRSAEEEGKNYFYQECYWGEFSRQVILPEEVDGSRTEAKVKDGVLTLRIPKIKKTKKKKIAVKQEE